MGYLTVQWKDFPDKDVNHEPLKLGFWTKVRLVLGSKIGLWYLASTLKYVPFFRQTDRKGRMYKLKSGTKCYVADHDLFLELRDDRWYALGNGKMAKQLNREVAEAVKEAEEFDAEKFFATVRQGMDNDAEALIQEEMRRAVQNYTTEGQS